MDRTYRRVRRHHKFWIRLYVFLLILILAAALLAQTAFAETYAMVDGDQVPDRAFPVTVLYHGEARTVASRGETAGELLSRLELELGGCDVTSHALDAQVTEGMVLRVDAVSVAEEVYTATVPHETTRCTDASLKAGTQEVLVEGRDGELLCTARVTYVNGVEAERTVLSQTQLTAPITRIVATGTAAEAKTEAGLTIGDGYIILESGEVLTYTHTTQIEATAYTHTDAGCDMITYTGTTVHMGTVAVDPRYIPYGTRMFIVSNDGAYVYGISVAEDCGGDIKGDRMDLYFPSFSECIQFGRRDCTVYFLG